MSLLLLVIGAAAAGYKVGRWWVVAAPLTLGLAVAGVVSAAGGSLHDTPLAFAVAAGATSACGGFFTRRLLRV